MAAGCSCCRADAAAAWQIPHEFVRQEGPRRAGSIASTSLAPVQHDCRGAVTICQAREVATLGHEAWIELCERLDAPVASAPSGLAAWVVPNARVDLIMKARVQIVSREKELMRLTLERAWQQALI